MATKELIVPCVHLNGTSKESLLDQYEAAHSALQTTFDALRQTVPNGRDFYPYGGTEIERALKEHYSRLRAVGNVINEIEALAEEVSATSREKFVFAEVGE